MDRPVLHAFVRELAGHERLSSLTAALPARVRVSEPALPLLVSALHERLERALTVLVADDEDARNLAEAAGWFMGEDRVAFLPSRGVRWEYVFWADMDSDPDAPDCAAALAALLREAVMVRVAGVYHRSAEE